MKVDCGCGRTMTLDALRGPGAFRCGCGARVKVMAEASRSGCTASDCRATAIVASSGLARLCAEHDKEHMLQILPRVLAAYPPHTWLRAFAKHEERYGPPAEPLPGVILGRAEDYRDGRPDPPPPPRRLPPSAVVYFLRVGQQVKIGTALRLSTRMEELNPPPGAEVVLTVPGSYDAEGLMHRRFADERYEGTEWFDLSPRLEEFIASRASARPPWTRLTARPAPKVRH